MTARTTHLSPRFARCTGDATATSNVLAVLLLGTVLGVSWPHAARAQHAPDRPPHTAASPETRAERHGSQLGLVEAVRLSRGDQPAIDAFESDAVASEEAAVAARTLPDLQVTAGVRDFPVTGRNRFSPTADNFTMYMIGLMREQVRRSKREAEAARLRAEAFASRKEATAQERRIQREVMIAWLNAVEAKAKQNYVNRLIADLNVGHQVSEASIPTGGSTPALALQMQAEIALAEATRAKAVGDEAKARGELARWIGAAAQRPLPDRIPTLEPLLRDARAVNFATHPEVLLGDAQQIAAQRQVDVARADRKRDLSWSVSYGWRPSFGDLVSANVTIPLLINKANRQDRRVAEAAARANAANLRTLDTWRELSGAYEAALAEYRSAEAQLSILTGRAIPSLEASFQAAEARYGAGQGSLEVPLTIVRRYIEISIEAIEQQAQRARAAAELTYLTEDVAR